MKRSFTVFIVVCNTLFILWILRNGIAEGFSGTLPQKVSLISLMILLAINSFLLVDTRRKK